MEDPETASMIRRFAKKKEEAIANEQYKVARQMKDIIKGLTAVKLMVCDS